LEGSEAAQQDGAKANDHMVDGEALLAEDAAKVASGVAPEQ
jgi:hypothetical protein